MQADRSGEKRLQELAERTARTGLTQITHFLTPAEQAQAEICARKAGVLLKTFGGAPDAERRMAAFVEDGETPEWPALCLRIAWNEKYAAPGHRDILGSMLALGFERESMGDICVGSGVAQAVVRRDIAEYMAAGLDRVGGTSVRVSVTDAFPESLLGEGEPVRATLSSLRLDALVGGAWNLSRSRAADLVESGRVFVNYRQELRPDRQLSEGMLISARGLGRARLHQVQGTTRKGRIGVLLLRYGAV